MNPTTTEKREIARLVQKLGKRLGNHLGVEFKEGDSLDNLITLLNATPAANKSGRPPRRYVLTKGEGKEKQTIEARGIYGVSCAIGYQGSEITLRGKVVRGEMINGWRVTPAGE